MIILAAVVGAALGVLALALLATRPKVQRGLTEQEMQELWAMVDERKRG